MKTMLALSALLACSAAMAVPSQQQAPAQQQTPTQQQTPLQQQTPTEKQAFAWLVSLGELPTSTFPKCESEQELMKEQIYAGEWGANSVSAVCRDEGSYWRCIYNFVHGDDSSEHPWSQHYFLNVDKKTQAIDYAEVACFIVP